MCRFPPLYRSARQASGHEIFQIEAPDRHSIRQGLRIRAQGPAHRHNQWYERVSDGNVPRYLFCFHLPAVVKVVWACVYLLTAHGCVGGLSLRYYVLRVPCAPSRGDQQKQYLRTQKMNFLLD